MTGRRNRDSEEVVRFLEEGARQGLFRDDIAAITEYPDV